MSDDSSISAEELDGLQVVKQTVTEHIATTARGHEHLDADALHVETMYIVGSIGAGEGRKGSDLDLIVMLSYDGEASGDSDWLEYVQHDVEPSLQRRRSTLANPLPEYIGYIDPKLGDQYDAQTLVRDMSQHGGYDTVYDLRDCASMDASRF